MTALNSLWSRLIDPSPISARITHWQGRFAEVKKNGTRSNTTVLMLCALLPAGMWAVAMKIIVETKGYHSTAGIWALLLGFPGDLLGAWIGQRTDSDRASYFAGFLGIWLFWFALLKAAVAIKHRLSRS